MEIYILLIVGVIGVIVIYSSLYVWEKKDPIKIKSKSPLKDMFYKIKDSSDCACRTVAR